MALKELEDGYLEESFRKEVLKTVDNKLSKKEQQMLLEEAATTLDFLKQVDTVEIPEGNHIVFTDGNEQLLYENGEFYVISTKDGNGPRKKKTKKQATEMYLDFFIRYQLNPILDQIKGKDEKIKIPKKEISEQQKVQKEKEALAKIAEKILAEETGIPKKKIEREAPTL